ncbi:amidohydrolase family protein [Henriciella aquimarina]|uniref:amidohydrolase family protein n=1 Tax=Henriciella aquimarina TaxID=545261 RepID=UPI000A057C44|nr:amidohydrolase family protein [Henriciella aquimarina]
MPLIDVHCHISPIEFPAAPSSEAGARWPCMRCASKTAGTLLIGEKPFRELDDRSWDVSRRLEDMDRDRVSIQVLSPMPELLSYWHSVDDGVVICDAINAQISEMISQAPGRFRGLGGAPLQEPKRAAGYLKRIKEEFGLSGVEIGSNINGIMLGDPSFDVFYAEAEALGLAVFVHALHPVAAKTVAVTPSETAFVYFPLDVAMAAASVAMTGLLERFPRLRIAFSHGGGALGSIIGRMDTGWELTEGFGGSMAEAPSAAVRKMFFDSNVLDPAYLSYLVREVAPGRIFLGTDYPYLIRQQDPAQLISNLSLSDHEVRSLRCGAAEAFLGETFGHD